MNDPFEHLPLHRLKRIDEQVEIINRKLDAVLGKETKIMSALTDLQASTAKFLADVETYKTNVAQKIADAVAADEAGRDVDLKALQTSIDTEDSTLTAATPPAPAPTA